MSDRELLELAAKAVGLHQHYGMNAQRKAAGQPGLVVQSGRGNELWNPLENDGEAFRLAVDLSFGIDPCADCGDITIRGEQHQVLAEVAFTKGESPMPHIRRAIVMAAAAGLAPPQPTPYK